jgi:diadenosine tetraphosphatase ApaH/serine/threonine PP2A family protein phosphatase
MVYGLISDIHASLEAFDAVLAELAGVDAFLCLGDIVGYGPDPAACIARLRGLSPLTCIAGNHDLAAVGHYELDWFNPYARQAIVWTDDQLSADEKAYLSSLSLTAQVGDALLVHGALPQPMDYITNVMEAAVTFGAMSGSLCFVGHTHVAEYYREKAGSRFCEQVPLWAGGEIALEAELRYIVNPGSIGQPRDGNPQASFGIYDTEKGTVEVRRVGYDIKAVQQKMRDAGLPEYLIERLERGR